MAHGEGAVMPSRKKVFDMFGGKCAYCGKKIEYDNFHVDHIVPKKAGGHKDPDNVFPSCPDCNNFKCDRSIEEFRERIENIMSENIATRMMAKYYGTRRRRIVFLFEEIDNG